MLNEPVAPERLLPHDETLVIPTLVALRKVRDEARNPFAGTDCFELAEMLGVPEDHKTIETILPLLFHLQQRGLACNTGAGWRAT